MKRINSLLKAMEEYEEEERQNRLGPGGLDPVEVYDTLPEVTHTHTERDTHTHAQRETHTHTHTERDAHTQRDGTDWTLWKSTTLCQR
jgi:cell division cycle protein 37